MIDILLADDHQIVIDGLKMLLSNEKDIRVLACANNGKEVLKAIEVQRFDIVVLDVEMPEKDGIDTALEISEKYTETKVLMLTMYNDQAFIRRLIEIGVKGYILKNKGKEELVEAIRDIASGKTYFGREVTNALISGIQSSRKKRLQTHMPLTKREKDVLKLIADGMSTPEISEKLFIAHSTVETHRRNLIDKTGVANSKALIKWAFQNGFAE